MRNTIRPRACRSAFFILLLLLLLLLLLPGQSSAGAPLLRGGGIGLGSSSGISASANAEAPPKCAPHQCVAATIDWGAQSDGVFEFEVTIALNMQASSPTTATSVNDNPTAFDESNFAAIDAHLLLRYCGGTNGTEGQGQAVRIYRARLAKMQHRCNDRAGLLEEAGAGAKFALLNEVCSSHYPIFKYGPSGHWFAIAISGAKVVGVDFPDADKEVAFGVSDKKEYQKADESFKRALVYKLLSPPHTTACLPLKKNKLVGQGSGVTGCNPSNINRGDTLLVSDKRSNAMDGSSLPNDVLELNQALHIQETLSKRIDTNFEIVPPGRLNHAIVFESASFENLPTSMGSPSMLVRGLKIESRWDLVRIERNRIKDKKAEGCFVSVADGNERDGVAVKRGDAAKLGSHEGRSLLPRVST